MAELLAASESSCKDSASKKNNAPVPSYIMWCELQAGHTTKTGIALKLLLIFGDVNPLTKKKLTRQSVRCWRDQLFKVLCIELRPIPKRVIWEFDAKISWVILSVEHQVFEEYMFILWLRAFVLSVSSFGHSVIIDTSITGTPKIRNLWGLQFLEGVYWRQFRK